jgi:hypothetical protein
VVSTLRPAQDKILSVAKEQKAIVDTAWFANVDSIFQMSSSYAGAFYVLAVQEFMALRAQAKDHKFSELEFLQQLQKSLGSFWSDQLIVPASQLFESLSKTIAEEQEKLAKSLSDRKQELEQRIREQITKFRAMGAEWEATVQDAFQSKLGSPGKAFYASLIEQYLAFGGDEIKLNTSEFTQGMQKKMGALWNDALKQPLEEFLKAAPHVDMKALYSTLDHDKDGIVTLQDVFGLARSGVDMVSNYATDYAASKWNGILEYGAATLDYYIPEEEEEEEEEKEDSTAAAGLSLSTLKIRASQRLRNKALSGLNQVRLLSATRVKEIVHIDLIAYAEQMIDSVVAETKPRVVEARNKLNDALSTLRSTVSDGKDVLANASSSVVTDAALSPRYLFLKLKLQAAIERARVASVYGSNYVLKQDLSALPADVTSLFAKLPALVQQNAVGSSKSLTDLLNSVRDLFYWDASVSELVEESAENTKEMEEVEEKEAIVIEEADVEKEEIVVEENAVEQNEEVVVGEDAVEEKDVAAVAEGAVEEKQHGEEVHAADAIDEDVPKPEQVEQDEREVTFDTSSAITPANLLGDVAVEPSPTPVDSLVQ